MLKQYLKSLTHTDVKETPLPDVSSLDWLMLVLVNILERTGDTTWYFFSPWENLPDPPGVAAVSPAQGQTSAVVNMPPNKKLIAAESAHPKAKMSPFTEKKWKVTIH